MEITKHKRGDRHPETGLYFWAYSHGREDWVTHPELVLRRKRGCAVQKKQTLKFPERVRARHRAWCRKNRVKRRAWAIKWDAANQAKVTAYKIKYIVKKRKECPPFRLRGAMRCRIYMAMRLRGKRKTGRSMKTIGCTFPELRARLEAKFKPGMTWENYGSAWVVDHERPLALGKTKAEIEALCHFSNLQPLWKRDNLVKGAKLIAA